MQPFSLTPRQNQVLDFIKAYSAARGCSPSFEEIAAHLGLASKSGVFRLVHALEERGHSRLVPGRVRSITLRAPSGAGLTDLLTAWARASEVERSAFLDHVAGESERAAA